MKELQAIFMLLPFGFCTLAPLAKVQVMRLKSCWSRPLCGASL